MIGGNRKGQAAVEFLTTYGWALLVIAVVLVTLGWLGVFSPQSAVKDYCTFPVGTLGCENVRVTRGGHGVGVDPDAADVRDITLTNNFGRDIYVCGVFCSQQEPAPSLGYPPTGIVRTVVDACRGAAGVPPAEASVRAGEKWKPSNAQTTPCVDISNQFIVADAGSKLNANLYVSYRYADDPTGQGYDRMIVGKISATVQPNN